MRKEERTAGAWSAYFRQQKNNILKEFAELTEIDSVSFGECHMADCLKEKLNQLGFLTEEDDAGSHYGGNAGNVYGFLKGSIPGPPILLSAHMDTVSPGIGKKAVFHEDGKITSQGDTVLGADDVAGLVEILWGIRSVLHSGRPRRSIEVLFPIGEELYTQGSRVFDFSTLQAEEAYVLDLSGTIGKAALKAPTLISFEVTVKGKSAHAGFEPEDGIHAILAASLAVGKLPQGRVETDTTLNIGVIQGGTATNIVPENCTIEGEIRSYDHETALRYMAMVRKTFEEEAKRLGASALVRSTVNLKAYQTGETEPVVRRFVNACDRLGISPELTKTFGGSDCNTFSEHGIRGIVLSCGMYEVHSVREYTTEQDLLDGAALVAELITAGKV